MSLKRWLCSCVVFLLFGFSAVALATAPEVKVDCTCENGSERPTGDYNGDCALNVLDIVLVITQMLFSSTETDYSAQGDCVANLDDVDAAVNAAVDVCQTAAQDEYLECATYFNECLAGTPCDLNTSTCSDEEASDGPGYSCHCNLGYEADGSGGCLDIDECNSGLHDCDPNASCTNTAGAYVCTCSEGYQGDGTTCMPLIAYSYEEDEGEGMGCNGIRTVCGGIQVEAGHPLVGATINQVSFKFRTAGSNPTGTLHAYIHPYPGNYGASPGALGLPTGADYYFNTTVAASTLVDDGSTHWYTWGDGSDAGFTVRVGDMIVVQLTSPGGGNPVLIENHGCSAGSSCYDPNSYGATSYTGYYEPTPWESDHNVTTLIIAQ